MITAGARGVEIACRCDNPEYANQTTRGDATIIGLTMPEIGQLIGHGRIVIRMHNGSTLVFVAGQDEDAVAASVLEIQTSKSI